jgi:hypothetical protein
MRARRLILKGKHRLLLTLTAAGMALVARAQDGAAGAPR